ncbi:hypothetical protein [Pseudonocardia sp.]|uniref:hypothetical protein n=1 Tax=Pseudonocardia sp. TaxID=60912 RepID=UPI0026238171|nr:hypothetical protein [Pseudonocardia sp.]
MTYVLDAGALLAVERGDRKLIADLRYENVAGRPPVTHGGVVGQVWRGGSGAQVPLARALTLMAVVPLGNALGRRAGELLARAGTRDVIDAALVLLAGPDDLVLTSDPDDLGALARAARRRIRILSL